MKSIDFQSALISAFVGSVITLFLAYISASSFSALPFPIIAMLCGYVITGIVEGILSKGVTILEPAIGAVLVGIVLFIVVPLMSVPGFHDLDTIVLSVVLMNGVLLSALGGWVGEKLQGTLDDDIPDESPLDWSWVLCGAVLGTTITMLLSSSLVVILGYHLLNHALVFVFGLFVAGFVIGVRSPGVAVKESVVAGFLAVVLNVDIFCLSLGMLPLGGVVGGIVIGITATFAGSWVGEKVQEQRNQ
ncbi:MAG: hypothetical protein EAZ92_15055 [Candidatus Kapaibacterium sp.]|nr:MAG: hypothetical protein EAZ92_15055 [Candidatus Kapabacteria bacterium]